MKRKIYNIIQLILLSILLFNIIYNQCSKNIKAKQINNFISNPYKNNNINVLEIPKIDLANIVEKMNSNNSNLNKSLVYYKTLNYNNKIVIFGHSMAGYGLYFNRLDELQFNDIVFLYHNNYKITYKVIETAIIKNTDTYILDEERGKKELLLVTCTKKEKKMRLMVKLRIKSLEKLKK